MMMKEILDSMENQFGQSSIHRGSTDQLANRQSILDSYDHFFYDLQDTFISHQSRSSSGSSVISSIISPTLIPQPHHIDINQSVDRYLNIDTNHINKYEDNDGLPGGHQSASVSQNIFKITQPNILSFISQQTNLQTDKANQKSSDETKNIPKNFIKAILSYILQNKDNLIQNVFEGIGCPQGEILRFLEFIRFERKTKKYTIERLKNWWVCSKYGKAMRIICCRFLRKRCLSYIMTSKIEKKVSHLKYRQRFVRSMQRPQDFTNLK